jgi:hypothetical protein
MSHRRHRMGVAWPIILISIGVILLLNNMGVLSWSVWDSMLRLWPVILIAFGIDIMIGRRSAVGAVAAGILIIALFLGTFWLANSGIAGHPSGTPETIGKPLGGATSAEVTLSPAVGSLNVNALPAGGDQLVSGEVYTDNVGRLSESYHVASGVGTYQLGLDGTVSVVFFPGVGPSPNWSVHLSRAVPIQLTLDQGVGLIQVDLSELDVRSLNVSLGVGGIEVSLPGKGHVQAKISSGVGQTTVVVPSGVALRVRPDTALAGRSLPPDLQQVGDAYVSPGFESADNAIDLTVGQAIGNVTIRRGSP